MLRLTKQQSLIETMPVVSKYSDETIESLTDKLHAVLLTENANLELSLMVIGNLLSHIINTNVEPNRKTALVEDIHKALIKSTA